MANKTTSQLLVDSNKRALLKYTVIADGSATSNASIIKFSNLAYAMNANNAISNTDPRASYGVYVKRIFGNCKAAGYFQLNWENDANSAISVMSSGHFDYDMTGMGGDSSTISSPSSNTKGLLMSINSPAATDAMTLFIEMRKDARDFDAGQNADPVAFNR